VSPRAAVSDQNDEGNPRARATLAVQKWGLISFSRNRLLANEFSLYSVEDVILRPAKHLIETGFRHRTHDRGQSSGWGADSAR
jgi:hypothetical protein